MIGAFGPRGSRSRDPQPARHLVQVVHGNILCPVRYTEYTNYSAFQFRSGHPRMQRERQMNTRNLRPRTKNTSGKERDPSGCVSRILLGSWQGSASAKAPLPNRQTRQFGCVGTSQDTLFRCYECGAENNDVGARGGALPSSFWHSPLRHPRHLPAASRLSKQHSSKPRYPALSSACCRYSLLPT